MEELTKRELVTLEILKELIKLPENKSMTDLSEDRHILVNRANELSRILLNQSY